MRHIGLFVAILTWGCGGDNPTMPKEGVWRGVIQLQDQELPFNFYVEKLNNGSIVAFIKNAGEQLKLDEITAKGDSLVMTLHIFDAELRVAVLDDSLNGYYIKNYEKNYRIPFYAVFDRNYRFFPEDQSENANFNGTYEVTFANESDTTPAIGVFEHKAGNVVEGTFLTPTGDYRYLEGNVKGNHLMMSTFDGNHAYLFSAEKTSDTTLTGHFWSGKTWSQGWTATLNPGATLPDADALTYLREGYEKISFRFPDTNGEMVSPTDPKFKNKVLILQIFGTWCPNCMDETRFLASWYKENHERGVEILGMAYEAKNDFSYARDRVLKMKEKLDVPYDFVIAGTKDKTEASKTLPMLNGVIAFPTTIFIGRDGKLKKIHTGFSGPGTGKYFEHQKESFNETVNELLKEELASAEN